MGPRRVALRQHEEGPLLELQRMVAGEEALQDRDGLGRIGLHQAVEGVELQVLVVGGAARRGARRSRARAPAHRHRDAGAGRRGPRAAELDLQGPRVVEPRALRVGALEGRDGGQSLGAAVELRLRPGLPVEGCVGFRAALGRDRRKGLESVGPALVGQGALAGAVAVAVGGPGIGRGGGGKGRRQGDRDHAGGESREGQTQEGGAEGVFHGESPFSSGIKGSGLGGASRRLAP
jgi:hypothetical protein